VSGRAALLSLLLLPLAGALTAGCSQSRPSLAGGPYVQQVTSSSVIVAAVTDRPEQLTVRVGAEDEDAPLDREVADPEPVEVHGLKVVDLAPATTYRYVVEDAAGRRLGAATFTTAPAAEATRVTFLVLGDSGGTDEEQGELVDGGEELIEEVRGTSDDENQQAKVCRAMLEGRADLILHTGDVVYPAGAREDYPAGFFEPFAPLIASVPVYPTLGNHDVKTQGGAPFLETFFTPTNGVEPDGRTYSFDWANVHFTCLDVQTTSFAPDSPQVAWLERDLAATDRQWKVVWFHNPAIGASTHGDDEGLKASVVPVLERHGVDLVLTGHDHVYARFFPVGDVTYVTSGGGGKNLYAVNDDPRLAYAESVFHFVRVDVDGRELTLRATDASGRVFDTVVIRKS
jgi:predicted phosphodiesterase